MNEHTAAPGHADGPDYAVSLRAHLDRGFRSMRFEPALEAAYREGQFRDGLTYLRINLATLMALVLAIVQVDRVVMPGFSASVPTVARLGVMVPILAVALGLSFPRAAPLWYPRVMTVLMTIALMAIGWIGLLAWSLGENRVFVRLVIATIAVYFVMGLRFRLALGANLLALIFYAFAAMSWHMPTIELAEFLAMLLLTSMICAVGAYNLEHARRIAWLEGQLLAEFAVRDGLTGILNRRRLDQHLQQVWQQGLRERKAVAFLFSDVDCFKAFNDHYGHQAGDEALKAVAAVHARFGRRPLDMAARFGGEEFAIVLFDTSREDALRIADRIMTAVRGLGIVHARSSAGKVLTVSVGIACLVPTIETVGTTSASLLRIADQALYAAKDAGGNQARLLETDAGTPGYSRRHQWDAD